MAFALFELDQKFFPTPWTLESWQRLGDQDRLLVVAMLDQIAVGFCLFDKSSADSFAHLLKILITPEFREKGLSHQLLIDALGQLQAEDFKHYFLEVEENNLAAQKLYLAHGFKVIHRKKDFYGTDRAALIMTK